MTEDMKRFSLALDDLALKTCADLLKSRRTIYNFRSDPVPDLFIRDAIEVASWAPNHKLTEPWHFYVLGQKAKNELVKLIVKIKSDGQDDKTRKAMTERMQMIPNSFIATCETSEDTIRQLEDYAACCCAVQNLMIYLWQAGIGVKWNTGRIIRDERIYEVMNIDQAKQMIIGIFWYGYPAYVPVQMRKPVSMIYTEVN